MAWLMDVRKGDFGPFSLFWYRGTCGNAITKPTSRKSRARMNLATPDDQGSNPESSVGD